MSSAPSGQRLSTVPIGGSTPCESTTAAATGVGPAISVRPRHAADSAPAQVPTGDGSARRASGASATPLG